MTERLLARHGGTLLRVASRSITHGVEHGRSLEVDPNGYPPELRAKRATFVTLTIDDKLRGCIGKSLACKPLVADVAENAYAAAFTDNRFNALTKAEVDSTDIQVSVLSDPERMQVTGELDLIRKLRPGTDGVIIQHGSLRSLFLPDVWETFPEPRRFLGQLKVKAGLPSNYWSNLITAYRFTTASTSLSELGGTA